MLIRLTQLKQIHHLDSSVGMQCLVCHLEIHFLIRALFVRKERIPLMTLTAALKSEVYHQTLHWTLNLTEMTVMKRTGYWMAQHLNSLLSVLIFQQEALRSQSSVLM